VVIGEGALRSIRRIRLFVVVGLVIGCAAVMAMPARAVSATLPGVDVSHHNGAPDWTRVKAAGTRFVIAKVTEATTFVDDHYADNKAQLDALGLPFTAYHFAQPDTSAGDAVAQADFFVANAHLTGKNMVPVLDLERSNGLGVKKLTRWTKEWLDEVHAKLGVKAIIYTNTPFWKAALGNTTWFAANGYRLWIAHWTDAAQPTLPAANWGGRGWTLWQHSSAGTVDGIEPPVDLDRYNGSSLAALKIKNNR
jgi:lysozyme